MTRSRKPRVLALTASLISLLAAPQVMARDGQAAESAPVAEAVAASGAKSVATPALWKVADADTTIYLFGTIHILPEDAGWFHGPVSTAFHASNQLVTETVLDSPETLQKIFIEKGMRHDGKSLRDSLDEGGRAELEKALTNLGLPVGSFDPFEAWYASLLLSLLPLKAAGYDQANGVETKIDAMADAAHLSHHPLETPEYQIGLFASLPEQSQKNYLSEVLKQLPTLREDVAKVVTAWKTGDAEGLAELLNEDESDATIRKVLITDRNKAWAKWLEGRLAQPGVVFVAVGAGHLAGVGSVQDQLAKDGVRSVRVQ